MVVSSDFSTERCNGHCRCVLFLRTLDRGQHTDQIAYDDRRTADLEGPGLRVIRFWNSAVLTNCDGVCAAILGACGGEHPAMGPG